MKTLGGLVRDAIDTVESGYYRSVLASSSDANTDSSMITSNQNDGSAGRRSLVKSIESKAGRAIVCEIKFASPSAGKIDGRYDQVSQIAREMEKGGAAGLSVLTEPKNFSGSLENLKTARSNTSLPVIMKDIVVSKEQIRAASCLGASALLLVYEVFSEGYSSRGLTLCDAVRLARNENLEVIIETHSKDGLAEIAKLDCDIIGINNRDLNTFKTSISTTIDLLCSTEGGTLSDRLLISESGFESSKDISYLVEKLKEKGAPVPKAFLIGTSIMKSSDVRSKVSEFTGRTYG
jgi:indole-3-glycerol phosphate synthase